ncbi:MAG: type II toxin-antitoxin system HipA family toxin, partial [Muribaculaceae bacterium]
GTRTEIFRRMVLNILANNTDDHNKNFSFIMDEEGIWSLAPAYDMTYIFNSGGFLPEVNHCMMIRGKIRGVTIEDAKQFAKDCEIPSPDKIITEVAQAISQFRQCATKYGVKENWIAAIENTINKHLGDWGLMVEEKELSLDIAGHVIHNVRVEQSYGGNFHLYATIDGRYSKFVIRQKMEEYAQISKAGVHNLSKDFIEKIVKKYLLKG